MARSNHRHDFNMNIENIFRAVGTVLKASKDDILGRSKKQPLCLGRQIAVYLAKNGRTHEQLAKIFKRHHSNCVHSYYKIKYSIKCNDLPTVELLSEVEKELKKI